MRWIETISIYKCDRLLLSGCRLRLQQYSLENVRVYLSGCTRSRPPHQNIALNLSLTVRAQSFKSFGIATVINYVQQTTKTFNNCLVIVSVAVFRVQVSIVHSNRLQLNHFRARELRNFFCNLTCIMYEHMHSESHTHTHTHRWSFGSRQLLMTSRFFVAQHNSANSIKRNLSISVQHYTHSIYGIKFAIS